MPVPLAEMRLPAPVAVPPITVPFEDCILMPMFVLPNRAVPAASVPMKLPCTVVDGVLLRLIPILWPEMTLRAADVRPPIVLPVELKMLIPRTVVLL